MSLRLNLDYGKIGLYSTMAGIANCGGLIATIALKGPPVLVVLTLSWAITFFSIARTAYLSRDVLRLRSEVAQHGNAESKKV